MRYILIFFKHCKAAALVIIFCGSLSLVRAQVKPMFDVDSILQGNGQMHVTHLTSVSQIDSVFAVICTSEAHNYVFNDARSDVSYSNAFDYDTVVYKIQLCIKRNNKWMTCDSISLTSSGDYIPDGAEVRIGDVNLDGSADILLQKASDGRGNHQYYFFTVKTITGKLVSIKGFENLFDPQFDKMRGVFYSFQKFHGGETKSTYKIVNSAVQLVKGG